MTSKPAPPILMGDHPTFLSGLKPQELKRLRQIVFRGRMKLYPAHLKTNREADRIIESLGPKVAEQMIEQAVNAKVLH